MNRRRVMQIAGCALAEGLAPRLAFAQSPVVSHAAFDDLLKRYVMAHADGINRVDFTRWKASASDMKALKAYVAAVSALPLSKLPPRSVTVWGSLSPFDQITVVPVATLIEPGAKARFAMRTVTGPDGTGAVPPPVPPVPPVPDPPVPPDGGVDPGVVAASSTTIEPLPAATSLNSSSW